MSKRLHVYVLVDLDAPHPQAIVELALRKMMREVKYKYGNAPYTPHLVDAYTRRELAHPYVSTTTNLISKDGDA